jgi:hypothetical protein
MRLKAQTMEMNFLPLLKLKQSNKPLKRRGKCFFFEKKLFFSFLKTFLPQGKRTPGLDWIDLERGADGSI